jgi:hypothetical protein
MGLYTLLGIGMAIALSSSVPSTVLWPAQLGNAALWASFCLAASYLDKGAEKNRDDAYLYYLGVSGLRMLVYMATLGLAVYSMPGLRNRTMVLGLTVGFLCYTVVEVRYFVRNLRKIFGP